MFASLGANEPLALVWWRSSEPQRVWSCESRECVVLGTWDRAKEEMSNGKVVEQYLRPFKSR